jgi:hypothetical protein
MTTITRFASAAALVGLAAVVAGGCGKRYSVVPVSGTVTLDNKPLEGVVVIFQPVAGPGVTDAGPGSSGVTDANGKFTLHLATDEKKAGAVVGQHRVTLGTKREQAPDDDTIRVTRSPIPPKYERKPQEFTVPAGGTDKADFPLTSR